MDIDEITTQIEQIVKFVESLPESYRERTFNFLISMIEKQQQGGSPKGESQGDFDVDEIAISRQMKVFLQQHSISSEAVQKMFVIDEEGILPTYKLNSANKSRPDIHLELACLLAAENAIVEGKFSFSKEILKQRLIELDLYNHKDFLTCLRARDEYFINVDVDPVRISQKGNEKLATLFPEMDE